MAKQENDEVKEIETPGANNNINSKAICYGTFIRLQHINTKLRLHSHGINYHGGSKQQEITGYHIKDDNDWFIIKPAANNKAKIGDVIKNGTIIRLQHWLTLKYLHSKEGIQSPILKQQEVNGFDKENDTDNDWILFIKNKPKNDRKTEWIIGQTINLFHFNSQGTLHSHKHNLVTGSKQQEVTVFDKRDSNDDWMVEDIQDVQLKKLFQGFQL